MIIVSVLKIGPDKFDVVTDQLNDLLSPWWKSHVCDWDKFYLDFPDGDWLYEEDHPVYKLRELLVPVNLAWWNEERERVLRVDLTGVRSLIFRRAANR